ncbi:MAG: thiamine phosphate synthase [Opitutales bacterium]|nr:thiamine phosphate synthase [Opitutales bacterium]
MSAPDYTLYLVTDDPKAYSSSIFDGVEAAIHGGATMVQYRASGGSGRYQYETALRLKERLSQLGIPLIVNDRLDLALAVDADGLHVGQNDLPVQVARRLLGKQRILGLSITDPRQLESVDYSIVDYLGAGPVFATATKTDAAPAMGLDTLSKITRQSKVPVVAIGGINLSNAKSVFDAGVHGLAVVSALSRSQDPQTTARRFRLATSS